jgi:RNA polymerase sigma factor (sigma-70 family)
MATRQLRTALQHFRGSLYANGAGALSDAHLLERWTLCRDEVAFELLMRRHGPMVFGVCRRLLSRDQDAEDAFQATFLVLVRRAGAIRKQTALGSWLYKVAYRVALRARHKPSVPVLAIDPNTLADEREPTDISWQELRPILDEEVHHLPPRYRDVFVLCQLEGKTNEEAARELGCPLGTVLSRLSRARDRLRVRLTRRGVTVPAAALTTLLAQQATAAPPPLVVGAALKQALGAAGIGIAATAPVPAVISSLCQGVLRTMFLTKIKIALSVMLVVGLTGLTSGLAVYQLGAQQPADPDPKVIVLPGPDAPQQDNIADPAPLLKEKIVVKGAVSPVRSLVCSPDGERLAWGNDAGILYLWSVPQAKLLHQYTDHGKRVTCVVFSKDGKVLASAGLDGVIYLRDVASGKILSKMNEDKVLSVAFSPDGKVLASSGIQKTIHFWDAATGQLMAKTQGEFDHAHSLHFNVDGALVAVAGKGQGGKTIYFIWDVKANQPLGQQPADIKALAFSPDGKMLATGGEDGSIRLLQANSGKILRQIKTQNQAVLALAFSSDGKTLASAGKDQHIRLWDVQSGKQIFQGKHDDWISTLAISPQGKLIITGDKGGVLKIWDIQTGKQPLLDLPGDPKLIIKGPDSLNKLVKDLLQRKKSDTDCIEALFLATLGRYPTATESQFTSAHLTKHKGNREAALEDVVFMLTNTKEFGQHVSGLHQRTPAGTIQRWKMYPPGVPDDKYDPLPKKPGQPPGGK